ncbi:MAG: prepilin-type N-terminal cleavage/methylation domain-containing protein [Candidatus Omnitrophica bacterium]|nr:prepilin-type N-terminal cleavage/methylation domain-containing protein [Candidatus Omnitrophota bacterium]
MKKGFTLLELLIGITIFAIISGAVYTSLYLGVKVWKHEEKNNSSLQEIILTFELIETNLFSTFINPENENIKFKGSADRLEFFRVNNAEQLESVCFYLDSAAEKDSAELLVLRKRYSLPDQQQPEVSPEIVNNQIKNFKLSYFNNKENKWNEDWPEELLLPSQVKVEIDFKLNDSADSALHFEKYISIPAANKIELATDDIAA